MNDENLRPCLTSEEAKKRGRNGGIASGKAKRERKAMSEQMRDLLGIPAKKGKTTPFDKVKTQKDIESGNFTIEQQILLATVMKARKGDMRAVQMVRQIIGIEDEQATVSPLDMFASEIEKYKDVDEDEIGNTSEEREQD